MDGGELVFQMGPRPNRLWGTWTTEESRFRVSMRLEIVPVPVIKAAGQTFKGSLEISLVGIEKGQ